MGRYDTTGTGGQLVVNLQGRYGTLRSYYYNTNNVKTILNNNVGTIDYQNGIITLNNFNPYAIDNSFGQLSIITHPVSASISSTYNRIITLDKYDATAININIIAKSS